MLQTLADLPHDKNYSSTDKYHDFRKVFGSIEGQRVFRELLSWGHMFQSTVYGSPIDPYALAVRGAEQNYAIKLLAAYSNEPPVQQTTQKREK